MTEVSSRQEMNRQDLVSAILDLENDRDEYVGTEELAYELAHHVKGHIDELLDLRAASPDTFGANGEATAEGTKGAGGKSESKTKRRKSKKGGGKKGLPEGPVPELNSISPLDQARWIFMERFITLEKHEEILGLNIEPEDFAEYQKGLDRLVQDLLMLPRMIEAAETNDLPSLQKIFSSFVLMFRSPSIGFSGEPVPCSFDSLRQGFPGFFYKRKKKPNWYEKHPFYTDAIAEPRWVLCDTDFLNCTLRKPGGKLSSYARDWDLAGDNVLQKSVLEDLYDRIICGEALDEDLFSRNCTSITSTTYRSNKSRRVVCTVQRVRKVTIHGRTGIPHWKAQRRLWPGVFPTVVFP